MGGECSLFGNHAMTTEGFKTLDKSLFNDSLKLFALRVPSRMCQQFRHDLFVVYSV